MKIVALPVQHKLQSQRPVVGQKEVDSRQYSRASKEGETRDWRLEASLLSPQASSLKPLAPILVGRESELAQLQHVLEKVLRSERQIVFVSGEPGIGKTTLVDAFLAQIRDRADVRITSGQCVEQYGPGEAYLPLLEATTRLCRGPGGERRIAALQRYAPSWLAQLPSLLEPQELERLQQCLQGASRERMLRELAETAEGFATTRIVVLVLEDLHWCDVSTLEWITYMARRREPARLLILGTYRPADLLASNHPLRGVVQELQARNQCKVVRLAPLAEEAIAEYLAVRLNVEVETRHVVPLQFIPLLHQRTGGNPLFLVNTVDDLLRQGVFAEEAGQRTFRANAVEAMSDILPDTVRQLIERQLERLSEPEQRLLEAASVAGVEFTAAEAAAGLLAEEDNIEEIGERLARTGQWVQAAGVAEWPDGTLSGRYRFLHAVPHEVVYTRLAEGHRIHLHRRIAARKETAYGERAREIATELAVHFEEGRELRHASVYLEHAGRNALQRSANAEATRHLTHALTLLARLPASVERTRQELTLHLALGTPLLALRGYGAPEVRRHYQQARSLCRALDDPPDLFPVLWGLWISHAVAGDLSAAEEFGSQLSQFAEHMEDTDLSLQAHHALWTTLVARGELTTCQFHIEQGLRLYQTDRHYAQTFVYGGHDPGACCRTHGGFLYWLLGYPDRALQLSEEALGLGKELSHGQSLAWALSGKAMVHQFRGESMAAQKAAEEALALSTKQQFALWAAYSPAILGWSLVAQGKKEQGLAQTQAGLAALQATGTGIWRSQFLALLANAYGEIGQIQEGLQVVDEALVAAARNGEHFYEAELYRMKGQLTLEAGGWKRRTSFSSSQTQSFKPLAAMKVVEEAEGYFLKALAVAQKQQAKSWELRAATSLARLWQSQEKLREARTLLEDIYGWFTEGFETKDLQEAAALLRELGGRVQETVASIQYSVVSSEKAEKHLALLEREDSGVKDQGSQPNPDPRSPIPNAQHSALSTQHSSLFHYEGESWTIRFAETTCRLKDARGLHYIAHLLRQPYQDVHVITLITTNATLSEEPTGTHPPQNTNLPFNHTEGFSDASEILDPQARATYQQRLSELREELAEAQAFHDLGRSEHLTAEIDFLTHELARAVGLGGRAQRMGAPEERARVNITRTIKVALRKITEHHPVLGQHLTATIKTGVYCSYTPDPRLPITWQI
jgi:predicted ATPase